MTRVSAAGERGLVSDAGDAGERLQAIAAGLRAAGLRVRMYESRAGWDLTAVLEQPGGRESEVVVDDDGYVELRYWAPQDASPARVTEVIISALAMVHSARGADR